MSNESQERFVEAREGDVGDDVRVRDVQRRKPKRRRGNRVRSGMDCQTSSRVVEKKR